MSREDVAVFGAGYVGCVTAACLAGFGHRVWLVEVAPEKLSLLRAGQSPVLEPGLDAELGQHLRDGRVVPLSSADEAVAASRLGLVCVGTPSREDGLADLTQVRRVLGEIAAALVRRPAPYVITLRSTLPATQWAGVVVPLLADQLGDRFGREVTLAVNPEFLREGKALADFRHPPFVIVGTDHPAAAEALAELYRPVEAPLHVVSPGTASLLKYACNAFHAVKVAFANEIAGLEEVFGADANDLMEIFCSDRQLNISASYLRPGYAFGGACLPKDLRALTRVAAVAGVSAPLLGSVLASNAAVIQRSVEAVERLEAREVALIGLSFKPGTDDLRESPFVELAERLLGKGRRLRIYDPDVYTPSLHGRNLQYIKEHLAHLGLLLRPTLQETLEGAELVILGKPLPLAEVIRHTPPGSWMLDLTRQADLPLPHVLRLNGASSGPAPRPLPAEVG